MPDTNHPDRCCSWPARAGLILAVSLLLAALTGAQLIRILRLHRTMNAAAASRKWPTVEGRVLSSGIKESQGAGWFKNIPESEFKLEYSYTIDGQSYTGSRIYFGYGPERERERADDLAADYPAGKNVVVHYQPAQPAECALETGQSLLLRQQFHRAKNQLWTGAGVIIIVSAVILFIRRKWRQLQNY